MLARQRQFVADASHELRTPLTSVLANLELLAESLHGDQGDAARSALRSSQRMRRLVADLLLLARTDAARVVTREPCDLAQIVVEAAGELGPGQRRARDLARRPPGDRRGRARRAAPPRRSTCSRTRCATPRRARRSASRTRDRRRRQRRAGRRGRRPGRARPSWPATLFERFVRGAGDRGGSFGLGLAIVQRGRRVPRRQRRARGRSRAGGTRRALRRAPAGRLRPRRRRAAPSAGASDGHRLASRDRRAASAGAGRPRGSPPRRRCAASLSTVARISSSSSSA